MDHKSVEEMGLKLNGNIGGGDFRWMLSSFSSSADEIIYFLKSISKVWFAMSTDNVTNSTVVTALN